MSVNPSEEQANIALVLRAFHVLFNQHDLDAAEQLWAPGYIQHSAHIAPGRDGLLNLVRNAPKTLKYENARAMASGQFVMLHGRFSGNGHANWIVLDVVRVEGGRLAEHWDVIQDEATQETSLSGLPMFGDSFP